MRFIFSLLRHAALNGSRQVNSENILTKLPIIKKLAKQGNAVAQYNLGLMYFNGNGVPQNYKKAFRLLSKAAEQGYVSAQYNLGFMYYHGKGITQDYKQAVEWYTKAAQQGDRDSQFLVGTMYSMACGVAQDDIAAYAWWSISADQGVEEAKRFKEIAASQFEPQILAQAQELSEDYYQRYVRNNLKSI